MVARVFRALTIQAADWVLTQASFGHTVVIFSTTPTFLGVFTLHRHVVDFVTIETNCRERNKI